MVAGDTNGTYDAFVRDLVTGKTTRVSVSSAGKQGNNPIFFGSVPSAISYDGRYVAFDSGSDNLVAGDTNKKQDVFVRDRLLDNSHAADLQVTVIAKTASVKKGRIARYLLKVKNNGPDHADKVDLTNIVFNGTVTGIWPSQGRCSKAAVSVCNLGMLAAKRSARVAVTIRADVNPLTLQVSVNAAPKDNAPGNNVIKISTPVAH